MCCLEMSGNMCVTGCYSWLFLCVAWRCREICVLLGVTVDCSYVLFVGYLLHCDLNCGIMQNICVFFGGCSTYSAFDDCSPNCEVSMSFIACFIMFLYSPQMCAFFLWFCLFMRCLVTVYSVTHIHVLFLTVCWILLQFTMIMLAAVHWSVLQGAVSCYWYSSYISVTFSLLASSRHIILL